LFLNRDMKIYNITLVLFLIVSSASAQFSGHYNALNVTGSTNTLKTEIPIANPSVIGSSYLQNEWRQAQIILKGGSIVKDVPVKIELENANVEVNYNGQVKYLNLDKIDSIYFINELTQQKIVLKKADAFEYADEKLNGMALVQSNLHYGILKQYYIEILRANYNVAMDVGSKDHQKVKREKIYLMRENQLIAIKGSSKKIASQLGDDRYKALTIIKSQKLNLKDENDLARFIKLMES
jgi:hypothetical protein